jgi:uncharacterized membrane protein YhhN
MTVYIILFFLIAGLDWLAVARNWKKLEYIAKPAAMLVLIVMLWAVSRFAALPPLFFALGIFFSLGGDVFLMVSYARFSNRWFLAALVSFLLAHVSYITGLNIPLPALSIFWSLILAVVLALTSGRVIRRIVTGIRQKGLRRMERPVAAYGIVITLMLLSAVLTLDNTAWSVSAAGLVTAGAMFFYFSDVILAWNKFILPIKNGRLINMILYHLGQVGLVAGVLLQFPR